MDELEDVLKALIYQEFYEKNRELFEKDSSEYWHLCIRYYERRRFNIKEIEKIIKERDLFRFLL